MNAESSIKLISGRLAYFIDGKRSPLYKSDHMIREGAAMFVSVRMGHNSLFQHCIETVWSMPAESNYYIFFKNNFY